MLPATLIARPPEEFHPATVPFVRDLRDALRDAHQRVRDATKSSARTQKKVLRRALETDPFPGKKTADLVILASSTCQTKVS